MRWKIRQLDPEINYIESETDQQSIVKQILPPFGKDNLHNDEVTEPRKERRVADQ
jgi:hypothetical protein